MKITVSECVAHLRAHGYILHHLFGNWYLGRIWSINYRKFSPYWIYHFKDKEIPDRPTSL
jgi:hypothetical protein